MCSKSSRGKLLTSQFCCNMVSLILVSAAVLQKSLQTFGCARDNHELLLLQESLKSLCSKEVHQMQTFDALMEQCSTRLPIHHTAQLDGVMHLSRATCG